MTRKISLVLFISLFLTVAAFAQNDLPQLDMQFPAFNSVEYFAAATDEESIPHSISNNEFYIESLRLTKLAQETYDYGDYDASAGFALEAIRYALLSDEYISLQLTGEARRLLDWAEANNIPTRYPIDYAESKEYYEEGVEAHSNEEWMESIDASMRAINILAALQGGRTPTTTTASSSSTTLPSQYTVRSWASVRDCLWNIAGYSWVYNDPWRWRELYNANKARMPEPDNPNLIEPGFVLDIPSIRGETRQGMWESGRTYRP